ncbi:unnamed protein product [Caenorhabditis bovis]|uniref:Transthyretin-like family protein n=1 Tax=Caenorhabditis bovis TaxID=2654633 RepID=A0A8S1EKP2_9PELO|nr:unnamed protein product [Caenorhabditis bovis]
MLPKMLLLLATCYSTIFGEPIISVRVKGRLLCGGKPMIFFPIQLLERNIIFRNNVFTEGETDGDGFFDISGTAIDDNEEFIEIPKEFRTIGHLVKKVYDIGTKDVLSEINIMNCIS